MNRRDFTLSLAAMSLIGLTPKKVFSQDNKYIKPKQLEEGDTVGLIAPGTNVSDPDDIARAKEVLDYYGLKMKLGRNVLSGSGYKTRSEDERVSDIHDMFLDRDVKAVFCLRGGYGSIRLLDKIDYDMIKRNPKIFIGYSDITALHLAINKYSNLITFHGPVGLSRFTKFTSDSFERALFDDDEIGELNNPELKSNFRSIYPCRTIKQGIAKGEITGGNLSLISSLMGTKYEMDAKGKILMIEEVGEQPYRIDRMLSQLKLAGKFDEASGVIIGKCSDCGPSGSQSSTWDLTLGQILDDIFKDVTIPVFYGLLFGHTSDQLTLPFGLQAEMNANKHTLTINESGVI